MPKLPPHVGVIYDSKTLAVRRVVWLEDHEDGIHLFDGSVRLEPGVEMAVVPKDEVRGMQLYDAAVHAILKKTGRTPPTMEEVHAKGL